MFRFAGSPEERKEFREFIKNIEAPSPRLLEARLISLGYRGQTRARRALCLLAYRHVRRIIRIHREGADLPRLPSGLNHLLIGPTGSGKTFLMDLLFRKILKIPCITIDVTAYSETGYVGQDSSGILTRLLHASDNNPFITMCGIVCLDEFDKLSSTPNNATFAGGGTTKDITGKGVQRELLKMLEGAEVELATVLTQAMYAERIILSTQNITFVACGAFSGFKGYQIQTNDAEIGFGRKGSRPAKTIAAMLSDKDVSRAADFQRYGIMPELIGRFARVIPFQPLDEESLLEILKVNVLKTFEDEFSSEGVVLEVDEEVCRHIVAENLEKEVGARGLSSLLTQHLEEASFEVFGETQPAMVSLYLKGGKVHWKSSHP